MEKWAIEIWKYRCLLPYKKILNLIHNEINANSNYTSIPFFSYYLHVKLLQSCPTFCNPMDCSLPGSSVHGILQARILVIQFLKIYPKVTLVKLPKTFFKAVHFSTICVCVSVCVCARAHTRVCVLSCFRHIWLFATLWTAACQAPLMVFSKQEYWSDFPCPPLGDLPNPEI